MISEENCSCTNHMNGDYGRCKKSYKGGRICYISDEATCSDRKYSSSAKAYYSWIPCSSTNTLLFNILPFNLFLNVIIYQRD